MSDDLTITVSGLAGIQNALNSVVPQQFQGAYLQKMLAAAAVPIITDAEARARKRTGTMAADIFSFKDKSSTPTNEVRGISVRTGKRATKTHGDAYYWVWIEYGHAIITTAGRTLGTPASGYFGKTVKAYPAHPFMRPAYEAQKYASLQAFQDAAGLQLTEAANKAGFF